MTQPKSSATCDECKSRKVRCVKAPDSDNASCHNCMKRGSICRFGLDKRRARRTQHGPFPNQDAVASPSVSFQSSAETSACAGDVPATALSTDTSRPMEPLAESAKWTTQDVSHERLYVDHLLEDRRTIERRGGEPSLVKAHDRYVGSSGIAFFSDQKIASISDRLGHRKFQNLLEALSTSINSHIYHGSHLSSGRIRFSSPISDLYLPEESVRLYITAYFEQIHPIYPFLERQEFEGKVFQSDRDRFLHDSPSFSALYYSVLALGSQYHGCGSFEPGVGAAWQLYQTALGLFPDVLMLREGLVNIQAVTAMAIFARNSSCVQIGYMLTAEAARMVQSAGLSRAIYTGGEGVESHRTFWVVYTLEKTLSFACGRPSILNDSDIGISVPEVPESAIEEFDYFRAMCRFSRMISKAYDTLFSINATTCSMDQLQLLINLAWSDLECWRRSIPETLRPGGRVHCFKVLDSNSTPVALRIHYHYYSAVIAFSRRSSSLPEGGHPTQDAQELLLNACNTIITLTKYIDVANYTPIWILLSVPLSALFVLFDLIVHNPGHENTERHLSLLGIVAGYFCSLEYYSERALQTSLLSDIAHIARDYVHGVYHSPHSVASVQNSQAIQQLDAPQAQQQDSMYISQRGATLSNETLPGSLATADTQYSTSNFIFPIGNSLPEGIDLMDFFTSAL